jgi:hypothetical protein
MPLEIQDQNVANTNSADSSALSLRDQIEHSLATAEPVENDSALAPSFNRDRDDKGRFSQQAQPSEPTQSTTQPSRASAENLTNNGLVSDVQPAQLDIAKPPSTWTPSDREKWAELPEWAKSTILNREKQAAQALTRHDEDRVHGRKLQELATSFQAFIPAGNTASQVAEKMLQAHARMAMASPAEKTELLLQLGQEYGADLSLFRQSDTQAPPDNINPQFQALFQKVGTLEQQLELSRRDREQQEQQVVLNSLRAFEADTKNEFFNDVRVTMGQFIQSGVAETLQDAYDKAVWANPQLREILQGRERQKQSQESQKKTLIAKNASSSVIGSPGKTVPVGTNKPMGLRENLERASEGVFN